MKCEQWRELLVERLAGELAGENAARLQQHLDECPACAAEEANLLMVMTAAAPPLSPAADLSAMESRLVGEMRRLKEAPDSARARGGDDAGGLLSLFLRVPIPSYVVLLLVIGAVAGGFWLGRIERGGGDVAGPGRAPVSYPAADTSRTPYPSHVPAGEGSTRTASSHRGTASWARFATAPTDGISLAASPPADTL